MRFEKIILSVISIILLTFIIIFILPKNIIAIESGPTCGCQEFRQLSLQQPRMKGEDIRELQRELKKLGYYKQELNSIYDWNTYLAVKKFKKANDLPITGTVKKNIWLKLAQALNKIRISEAANKKIKPPDGEVFLLIDAYKKQMTVYSDGEPYHKFPVAVGKPSTKSPIGEWAIIGKDAHWGGGFGVRWMRLNVPWGTYGIHGTNKPGSIGTAASHGCIRMYNRDVKILYSWVNIATRVKIIGRRDPIEITHDLRPGQTGRDVLLLQEKLRDHGFDPGYTDGRFGDSTKQAIQEFKYIYGLQDDLRGDKNTLYILDVDFKH